MISAILSTLWGAPTPAQAEARVRLCLLICFVEQAAQAVDSFDQVYARVITSPADAKAVRGLPRGVRERLTRNEVLHRCGQGWTHSICDSVKKKPQ